MRSAEISKLASVIILMGEKNLNLHRLAYIYLIQIQYCFYFELYGCRWGGGGGKNHNLCTPKPRSLNILIGILDLKRLKRHDNQIKCNTWSFAWILVKKNFF